MQGQRHEDFVTVFPQRPELAWPGADRRRLAGCAWRRAGSPGPRRGSCADCRRRRRCPCRAGQCVRGFRAGCDTVRSGHCPFHRPRTGTARASHANRTPGRRPSGARHHADPDHDQRSDHHRPCRHRGRTQHPARRTSGPRPAAPRARTGTDHSPGHSPGHSPCGRPQAAGNSDQNARRGSTEGSSGAAAQSAARTAAQAQAPGNADVSNYPGEVMRRIQRVRQARVNARGSSVVAFTIADGGGLASATLARASGNAALDSAALDHIRRAAPFPAPPPGAQRRFSFEFVGR
ncbi:MAG: energy transducer TonB [Pararhodobacter sp.]